jgi:hypothetical protein
MGIELSHLHRCSGEFPNLPDDSPFRALVLLHNASPLREQVKTWSTLFK